MTKRILLGALVGAALTVTALPAGEAIAAPTCDKAGYKTLDQNKYVRVQRGPIPKGDSTSDFGYYAEGKGSAETTNEDFPPEVVAFLDRGIKFAIESPLPDAEEGAKWVFKENV